MTHHFGTLDSADVQAKRVLLRVDLNVLDQTKLIDGNFVRVLSWYDDDWGFSNRMANTAVAMGKLI